jgi:hypothetical protein
VQSNQTFTRKKCRLRALSFVTLSGGAYSPREIDGIRDELPLIERVQNGSYQRPQVSIQGFAWKE